MNGTINFSPGVSLDAVEKQAILLSYGHFRQNKTATANALGISIRTLDNKLERYEAEEKEAKDNAEQERTRGAEQLARFRGQQPATYIPSGAANEGTESAGPGHVPHGAEGDGSQSTIDAATQPPLPMPERRQIQEMLPRQATGTGHGKRR